MSSLHNFAKTNKIYSLSISGNHIIQVTLQRGHNFSVRVYLNTKGLPKISSKC